jgi:hypothetical protein
MITGGPDLTISAARPDGDRPHIPLRVVKRPGELYEIALEATHYLSEAFSTMGQS